MRFVVRVIVVFALACAAAVVAPVAVAAQGTASGLMIRGTVLDSTRAAIAGALVEVVAGSGSKPISVVTDQHGAFMLPVPTGRYEIRITADGFQPLQQSVSGTLPTAAATEFVLQVPGL